MTGWTPRVSIVVPALDPGPARLARCLDSLQAQDHPDVEVIVMDGGSRDGARELAGARAGVTLVAEPDDGQADAIQRGFDRATGELLGWLGADDTLAHDAIARAVAALGERPDAGWAYGAVRLRHGDVEEVLWPPRQLAPADFYWGNPVSQPGSLIRRAALEAIGGLDRSYHYAMDLDLWVRLLDAGHPGVHVDAVLATFEVHAGSKTGSAGDTVFLLEEARCYRDHGWGEAAALVLGQAIAAQRPGASPRALAQAAATTCHDPTWSGLSLDVVVAGALTRAAVDGLHRRSPGAVRHLAHPAPWRCPAARRRLGVAVRRLGARVLGRDPGLVQNRPPA